MISAGGSESISRPITMSSSTVYVKCGIWPGEITAQRTAGHYWALDLGMGDNKNFMSRYIIRLIITIIDIITISLNSATGTKIVEIS